MTKLHFFVLCVLSSAIGFAAGLGLQIEEALGLFKLHGPTVMLLLIGMALFFVVSAWAGYFFISNLLRKHISGLKTINGKESADAVIDFLTGPASADDASSLVRQKAAAANVALWIARRETTQFSFNAIVTVFGGLVGAATIFLLYEQNLKLDSQNQKITLQTDANIAQSVLLEGARRAALSADLANLLQDIRIAVPKIETKCDSEEDDKDLVNCWKESIVHTEMKNYFLDRILQERVKAYADRNVPYRLSVSKGGSLQFDLPLRDQFDFPSLSPERGELLATLVGLRVFMGNFDFSSAQLSDIDFDDAFLRHSYLKDADLRRSYLVHGDLREAWLVGANLANSDLGDANLKGVSLDSATLSGASLESAQISQASFKNATIDELTNFADVWAWRDWPPRDVPTGVDFKLCNFILGKHSREVRPGGC